MYCKTFLKVKQEPIVSEHCTPRSLGVRFRGLRSPSAVLENSPHVIDHGMPVLVIALQDPKVPPSMALKDAPTGKAYIPQGMIVVVSSKAIALMLSKIWIWFSWGVALQYLAARNTYTSLISLEAMASIRVLMLSSYPCWLVILTTRWMNLLNPSMASKYGARWFCKWHEVTWNQLALSQRSHISWHHPVCRNPGHIWVFMVLMLVRGMWVDGGCEHNNTT